MGELIVLAAAVGVCLISGAIGVLSFRASSPRPHRPRHAARRNPYAAPTGG